MITAVLESGIGTLTGAFLLKVFKESCLDRKGMRCVVNVPSLADHLFVRLLWNILWLPFECLQCAETMLNGLHWEPNLLLTRTLLSRFAYLMHEKTDLQRSGNMELVCGTGQLGLATPIMLKGPKLLLLIHKVDHKDGLSLCVGISILSF